jgi:hypothetical protein
MTVQCGTVSLIFPKVPSLTAPTVVQVSWRCPDGHSKPFFVISCTEIATVSMSNFILSSFGGVLRAVLRVSLPLRPFSAGFTLGVQSSNVVGLSSTPTIVVGESNAIPPVLSDVTIEMASQVLRGTGVEQCVQMIPDQVSRISYHWGQVSQNVLLQFEVQMVRGAQLFNFNSSSNSGWTNLGLVAELNLSRIAPSLDAADTYTLFVRITDVAGQTDVKRSPRLRFYSMAPLPIQSSNSTLLLRVGDSPRFSSPYWTNSSSLRFNFPAFQDQQGGAFAVSYAIAVGQQVESASIIPFFNLPTDSIKLPTKPSSVSSMPVFVVQSNRTTLVSVRTSIQNGVYYVSLSGLELVLPPQTEGYGIVITSDKGPTTNRVGLLHHF